MYKLFLIFGNYFIELTAKNKSTLFMHLAVLLWGITAILGRLIDLREFILVWYRMIMVAVILLLVPKLYKDLKFFNIKQLSQIALIGILVALHWVFFYGSIKLANVSVALCALATTSLFTAFIEPIISHKKFNKIEIALGLMIIPGIILINQTIPKGYFLGWMFGLFSAFLAALFTSLNKKYAQHTPAFATVWIQLASGALFLSLLLPIYIYYYPNSFVFPSNIDIVYLFILVVACTIVPYLLYLIALKDSTAFATNLINNLEPIYGIILAAIFFNENQELNTLFYIGSGIIFSIIFLHPILNRMLRK